MTPVWIEVWFVLVVLLMALVVVILVWDWFDR